MSGVLSIQGSVIVAADDDTTDFAPYLGIARKYGLNLHAVTPLELTTDSPVAVGLNGLQAHVLIMVANYPVTMTLTTDSGDVDASPIVGDFAIVMSPLDPYTAISFARVAGQATSVKMFVGQKAA